MEASRLTLFWDLSREPKELERQDSLFNSDWLVRQMCKYWGFDYKVHMGSSINGVRHIHIITTTTSDHPEMFLQPPGGISNRIVTYYNIVLNENNLHSFVFLGKSRVNPPLKKFKLLVSICKQFHRERYCLLFSEELAQWPMMRPQMRHSELHHFWSSRGLHLL